MKNIENIHHIGNYIGAMPIKLYTEDKARRIGYCYMTQNQAAWKIYSVIQILIQFAVTNFIIGQMIRIQSGSSGEFAVVLGELALILVSIRMILFFLSRSNDFAQVLNLHFQLNQYLGK